MEVLGKVLTAFCHQTNNHTKSFIFPSNLMMYSREKRPMEISIGVKHAERISVFVSILGVLINEWLTANHNISSQANLLPKKIE